MTASRMMERLRSNGWAPEAQYSLCTGCHTCRKTTFSLSLISRISSRKKIYFRHEQLPTKAINFEDMDPKENILDREKLTIGHAGKVLRPLQTRRGLVFIDTAQLQPLADLVDTLELYERETEAGGTYIAAKSGFMLVGVIMPYNIIEKGFVEQVESLAKQCRVAFEAKERARAVAAEDQQQTTII